MTGSLARYHARSPRYILDTEDNHLVRLSGAERLSWEEKTELRNISLTGLSFSAPRDLSPQLGEIIKIQFAVPGSQMMACYAIVIRIDLINDFENEIAVHFYKLDRVQRINLVQGLAQKLANANTASEATATKANKNTAQTSFALGGSSGRLLQAILLFTAGLLWLTVMKVFWL
jgi:PilZ domain